MIREFFFVMSRCRNMEHRYTHDEHVKNRDFPCSLGTCAQGMSFAVKSTWCIDFRHSFVSRSRISRENDWMADHATCRQVVIIGLNLATIILPTGTIGIEGYQLCVENQSATDMPVRRAI